MKVLTYNIAGHLRDRRPSHLEEVAEFLAGTLADVVGLQEVIHFDGEAEHPEDTLGRLTGMHVSFVPAHSATGRTIGNAVLSREPIIDTVTHFLPGAFPEQRVALEAQTSVRGEPISVFNTHLVHLASLGFLWRRRQADALARILAECRWPHVLVGDLNASPRARELSSVRKHSGENHHTGRRLRTWPAHRPVLHYDHIWPGPGWVMEHIDVLDRHVSDHLPVLARLKWHGHRKV